MALKPGYLIQPRAADIHFGEFTWEPKTCKKHLPEVFYENVDKKRRKARRKQPPRGINLDEFLDNLPDEPEPETQEPDRIQQAADDSMTERLQFLELELERAERKAQAEADWWKREEEITNKEREKLLAEGFHYKTRIFRPTSRKT